MKQDIITMTKKEAERLTIINNLIAKKINGTDDAKQLNLSVRQTKRLKARVAKNGTQGIIHQLIPNQINLCYNSFVTNPKQKQNYAATTVKNQASFNL